MKNRIVGIVAAITLAAVGTGVLVLYVKGAEQRALAGERTVEVLVVQAPIAKGTPAAELMPLVELTQVPAKVQAVDSIGSLDEVAGRVTAVDLVVGEQLVDSRFVDPGETGPDEAMDIPPGHQLVTVSLDPTRVLGGVVKRGGRVGVIASFEDAPADPGAPPDAPRAGQTTHFILNKILVANVQGEPQPVDPTTVPTEGEDAEPVNNSGSRPGAPGGNLLVTFAVDAPSAERLVFAAEYGTIWLSLQSDETSDEGTHIQTKDTIYR